MSPEFLTVDDVLEIHAIQIELFGGSAGVRDGALLESALAQPPAAFGDEYLHDDLFEMAAAYLFHISSNHPFVDGNKRVALAAALVFLKLNGVVVRHGTDALYELTMAVARGELEKPGIAARLLALFEA